MNKVVVDKPATIPVHPGGAYRYNSLVCILAKEYSLENLHIINRLDRLTSGVVLLARNAATARKLSEDIQSKRIRKTYLAKVTGRFPWDENALKGLKLSVADRGELNYNKPKTAAGNVQYHSRQTYATFSARLGWVNRRDNIRGVDMHGKEAVTKIRLLRYMGDNFSLLECQPITGRTHQIRVHLKVLGFPIANDPQYGPEDYQESDSPIGDGIDSPAEAPIPQMQKEEVDGSYDKRASETLESISKLKLVCPVCQYGDAAAFNEIQLRHRGIWLHALSYEGEGWKYTVDLPDWVGRLDGFV